eukprot:10680-Heterococcus_DN1.PRE.1
MISVLEARCDVKAWATPQPLGAHAADGAGSGFAITAVKTEDGTVSPFLLVLDIHDFLRSEAESEAEEEANAADADNDLDNDVANDAANATADTQTVVSDDIDADQDNCLNSSSSATGAAAASSTAQHKQ